MFILIGYYFQYICILDKFLVESFFGFDVKVCSSRNEALQYELDFEEPACFVDDEVNKRWQIVQ